jgi:hypothetical protein
MRVKTILALLAPILAAPLLSAAADGNGPVFTPGGDLVPPANYREWIFLSSGVDMSYTDRPAMAGQSMFDNVFVNPEAWRVFKATGHWPDKTMFVLEARGAESKGSINKLGHYQNGDVMGTELHVRDDARFKGGWGFFPLDGKGPTKMIGYQAQCYSCHQEHGAVDTTFTQFYPTAKAIAVAKGTYLDR